MGKIKNLDIEAQAIASLVKKDIYRQCSWALDSKEYEDLEGKEFNDTHSYLMQLVARQLALQLGVITNPYYDET